MVGHDVQMRKIQNRHAMVAGAHCENSKIAPNDSKRSERELQEIYMMGLGR